MTLTRSERDQWAEELESGRWKQCHGALTDTLGGYCSLGVLVEGVLGLSASQSQPITAYDVVEMAITRDGKLRFAKYNDHDRLSFPEIAKHVRALPVSEEEAGT